MSAKKKTAETTKRDVATIVEIRVDPRTGKWILYGPGGVAVEVGRWTKADGGKKSIRVSIGYDASAYMEALVERRSAEYRAELLEEKVRRLEKVAGGAR